MEVDASSDAGHETTAPGTTGSSQSPSSCGATPQASLGLDEREGGCAFDEAAADRNVDERDPVAVFEEAADVEVIVEGVTVRAHSVVLGLASPVFAALLRSGMRDGLTKQVTLEGKSKEEFELFLSFLLPVRGRKVPIDARNVDVLLRWFDEYQVDLKDECEELLLKLQCSVERLLQAHAYGLKRQYSRCLRDLSAKEVASQFEKIASVREVVRDVLPVLSKQAEFAKLCSMIGSVIDTAESFTMATPFIAMCLRQVDVKKDLQQVAQCTGSLYARDQILSIANRL